MTLRRLPLASSDSGAFFAEVRLALVGASLITVPLCSIAHGGRLELVLAAVALPWSLFMLVAARRGEKFALDSRVALLDFAVLLLAQLAAPDAYAAIRFVAIFLVAAHALLQGEPRGALVGLLGIAAVVPATAATHAPIRGSLLTFYEVTFALSAIATAVTVARMRTAESTGRLRALELSRRGIEAENEVRRRVAESIHDGPVQELVSLDMMLESARRSLERGDNGRAAETLEEARMLTERNVTALREEIVGLGPYAFDELSLGEAIEQCVEVWSRRYDIEIELKLERVDLPNDVSGALFGITQEAVANAGRHAGADRVWVAISTGAADVELVIRDDGHGFQGPPPLSSREPGHIGLASMRERAELLGGTLQIESSDSGSVVSARVPYQTGDGKRPRGDAGAAPVS